MVEKPTTYKKKLVQNAINNVFIMLLSWAILWLLLSTDYDVTRDWVSKNIFELTTFSIKISAIVILIQFATLVVQLTSDKTRIITNLEEKVNHAQILKEANIGFEDPVMYPSLREELDKVTFESIEEAFFDCLEDNIKSDQITIWYDKHKKVICLRYKDETIRADNFTKIITQYISKNGYAVAVSEVEN